MEVKELVMLIVLLAVAFIGSGTLVYVMQSLDKEDDNNNDGGGSGH